MRAVLLIVAIGALVGFFALRSEASHLRCHTGNALGFVAIRSDPAELVGQIPSRFTSDPGYFSSRYNCTGRNVQARRVDQGIYDVRFPGIVVRVAVADAISTEGVSTSVQHLGDGVVRIALRGPLGGSDVAARRDVAFNVVVY